ncbi:MAG: HdeD family acid-resistance protein [Parvibaculum sp.]|uniref:HdeD family acid-resistance protein n=1 Tax=Parvibaculum sp. TaxID=2024848 RepID=UPI003C744024
MNSGSIVLQERTRSSKDHFRKGWFQNRTDRSEFEFKAVRDSAILIMKAGCTMSDARPVNDPGSAIAGVIHQYRRRYLVAGGLLVIGGILSIAFPFFGTLAAAIFVGWILVVSGIVEIVHAFSVRGAPVIVLNLLAGLLSIGVGVMFLANPVAGALSLTLLLAGFLAADGIIRILSATQIHPFPGWGWILVNGVSSLLLAAILLWLLPEQSLYALGILLGIDLLVAGGTLLLIASAAKALTRSPKV